MRHQRSGRARRSTPKGGASRPVAIQARASRIGDGAAYEAGPHEVKDSLQEFLSVLSRRKLVVLLAVLLTPIGALVYSTLQTPIYEASAAVLVTSGGAAGALSEVPGLASGQPERVAGTNIGLARLPRVAERVTKSTSSEETPAVFLDRSSVTADLDADLLRFNVHDANARRAPRIATAYAQEFTRYRNELDVQSLRSTRATITRSLAKLAAAGGGGSALDRELEAALRRLDTAEALQGSAAILVQPAVGAERISPRTKRNLLVGLALGIVLAIGIALLVDRLDVRVRSAEDVEGIIAAPLIGELSTPPRLPQGGSNVSMVVHPYGAYAESVRRLRANVEFANVDVHARTIMVTSALRGEGKTTTAADLAVALARSGRSVVLCDLDAREPSIDQMFNFGGRRGLVEVAFGVEDLDRALVTIPWSTTVASPSSDDLPAREADQAATSMLPSFEALGELRVLPFGRRRPPSPADFAGSAAVHQIIAELAESHDFVVLDTPPLVPVSDGLTIAEYADAAVIVAALASARRPTLRALRKLVSGFPARVLGVVVTGVPAQEGYGPYFLEEPPVGALEPLRTP